MESSEVGEAAAVGRRCRIPRAEPLTRNWVWTIIGERTVIVIVNNAGCTCCQGDHSVGIGRPVDVNGLL